jgi:TolA-binding protein
MSRNDIDSQLMDYLYDELSPSQRESFEREIAQDDALREKVQELQATRSMLQRAIPPNEAPVSLMQDLLRESRLAADVTEKEALWSRIANWLMRPSMATAMLVLVVAVTGVYITSTKDSHLTRSATEPESPSVALKSAPQPTSIKAVPIALEETDKSELRALAPLSEAEAPPLDDAEERDEGTERAAVRIIKEGTLGGVYKQDEKRMAGGFGRAEKRAKRAAKKGRGDETTPLREVSAKRKALRMRALKTVTRGKDRVLQDKALDSQPSARAQAIAKPKAKQRANAPSQGAKAQEEAGSAPDGDVADGSRVAENQAQQPKRNLNIDDRQNKAATPPPPIVSTAQADKLQSSSDQPSSTSTSLEKKKKQATIATGSPAASKGDYALAIKHYKNQRYDDAINEFRAFLDNNRSSNLAPDAERNIARSYRQTNRLRRAMSKYRTLLKRFPKYRYRSAVLIETARLELAVGELDAARLHLKEAAKDKSISKEAKRLLSRVNLEMQIRRKASKKTQTKAAKTKAAEKAEPPAKTAEPAQKKVVPPSKKK